MSSKDFVNLGLPPYLLLQVLEEKQNDGDMLHDTLTVMLGKFAKVVSDQMGALYELFPEFTPHDKTNHLDRLISFAGRLLGEPIVRRLNRSELFILSAALYGHDWGMALSSSEREDIVRSARGEEASGKFPLLRDEGKRLRAFLERCGTDINQVAKSQDLSIDIWKSYVRETHAFRSGLRIEHHFRKQSVLGTLIRKVAEGHALNIKDLDNFEEYSEHGSFFGDTVNVRALAVYTRLVDLFDISQERTPYALWRFISPQDPISRKEWEKHHAILSCNPVREGHTDLTVIVEGSTPDHELYASLEDSREYCDQQLKGCIGLLERSARREQYSLGNVLLDWKVKADGFEPILVRFEFDKERMLDILGTEVYEGNRMVFLRELLQNSIDAMRMRRELLKRQGIKIDPTITVKIFKNQSSQDVIEWTDQGIGMDEFVVSYFLTKIGTSFYSSKQFLKESLTMDPISQFGIGILSCFMVADSIEIDTARDNQLFPGSEHLHISVPSANRNFRVQKMPFGRNDVGTTVRIFPRQSETSSAVAVEPDISDQDWFRAKHSPSYNYSPLRRGDVTRYLERIAPFVEFPIVITEDGVITTIMHPDARHGTPDGTTIFRIADKLDLKSSVAIQDLEKASNYMRCESLNLSEIGNMDGVEGFVDFVVPNELVSDYEAGISFDATLYTINAPKERIRFTGGWGGGVAAKTRPDEVHMSDCCAVDGIAVEQLALSGMSSPFPMHSRINITDRRKFGVRLNLTRTNLASGKISQLWGPIEDHLASREKPRIAKLDGKDRFMALAKLMVYYHMSYGAISRHFSAYILSPVLLPDGKFELTPWSELRKRAVSVPYTDKNFMLTFKSMLTGFVRGSSDTVPMVNSEPYLLAQVEDTGNRSSVADASIRLTDYLLAESHTIESVSFAKFQMQYGPEWVAIFRCAPSQETQPDQSQHRGISQGLSLFEKYKFSRKYDVLGLPSILPFSNGFDSYFSWDWKMVNTKHPGAIQLFNLVDHVLIGNNYGDLQQARFRDTLRHLNYSNKDQYSSSFKYADWKEAFEAFVSLAEGLGCFNRVAKPVCPEADEFVGNSRR